MNKLVLTGFMGTGKTTLAALVAERTQTPLVDTDALITAHAGLSIPAIFEQFGEAGFRAWEAAICAEVAADPRPLVISTGGGLLMNPTNRQLLEANATIVCLNARPEVIYHRAQQDGLSRPLLAVADPLAEIERLLTARRPVYQTFRWQIDTSDQAPAALADTIIALWQRDRQQRTHEQRVRSPEGSYPLVIQEGALASLAEWFDCYGLSGRRIIIGTNDRVGPLYAEQVARQLPNASMVTLPDGETYKNLDTVNALYTEMAQHGLDRGGVIVALGGGVVGDTIGYVAATYMRGVRLVQIPTTLLAMVDSSVGGKVGVDIPSGKNLVGAFKQPELVLVDPAVLQTLPPEEMRAGMAELIKHAFLANPALLDENVPLVERIRAAVQVKIDIVQRDPYEQGERAYLNLGHTFGHAIEQVSGYTWRHGDAVGVGLVGAAWLSQSLGLLDAETSAMIEATVARVGLPTRYRELSPTAIWEAMHTDKKWQGGRSYFVVLRGLGQPTSVRDVPREMVIDILEALRDA